MSLTLYDKDVIESTEGLLSDKHMLAANEIFANQFPSLQGLQSTLLCQSDGFVPISIDGGSGYITEGKLPYTLLSCTTCMGVVIKTVIIVLFVIALQIFFEPERAHWVATAYIDGEVRLFDSSFNGRLSRSIEYQISRSRVYGDTASEGNILVTVVPVPQ